MRRLTLLLTVTLLCGFTFAQATELEPRLTWDKQIFADGVNPEARDLTRLIVKYYDEDMVRQQNGSLESARSADLTASHAFLASHPEVTLDLYMKRTDEAEYQARTAQVEEKSGKDLVDLFSFQVFSLEQPAADPHALLAEILAAPEVELAYYESIPIDFTCTDIGWTTPDYRAGQTYHDPAPLGTDRDYAEFIFGPDVVDGDEYTWTGIFERGMQITHEDVTNGWVSTLGTPDSDNNHGTAVMGILGTCDDNLVGMVGYLADQQMVLYQRNSGSYGSVAEIYDEANAELLTGELTNSSWGYLADPLPDGQSCPCNPGQNGAVACEYDPGVKASIAAGVADGYHYFLAAGNGCVDLDDVVFGTLFQWSTETGSVYVGGSESPVVGDGHDPRCYTNFGSRVTSYGWAQDIYTTGYGYLFSGSGRDEWYDNDFGGTSGASPMVGGCGGILNNIWRSEHAGDNIAPATLRALLQINGTPCNDPSIEIGVLPDLFGILAPDLEPYTPGGWDAQIVPTVASGDPQTIPSVLNPAPASTFMNWSWWNRSHFMPAAPARGYLYLDDVYKVYAHNASLNPWTYSSYANWETTVRGGSHYLKEICDATDLVDEGNEENQTVVHRYVWDGYELAEDVPETFSRGPLKTPEGSGYYACDGFYNGGDYFGFWEVFGVMPEVSADYDIRVHSEATSATNGFDDYEGWSAYVSHTDFVGCNNNVTEYGDNYSVVNWADSDEDYTVEGDAATGDAYFGSLPAVQELAMLESLDSGEILDVYEMNLDAGVDVWFEVYVNGGDADIAVSIYGPDRDYFTRSSYDGYFNAGGAGESESGVFTPTADGYHGVVVYKHLAGELNEYANYEFYWGPPVGDLVHFTRTDWSYELVARNQGVGITGVLPATLIEGNSVADNGYLNQGAGYFPPGSNTAFYLDGPYTTESGNFTVNVPPGDETHLQDKSLGYVKGGRHEVGAIIDVHAEVVEELPDGEFNNYHYTQYSWAPYALTNQVPVLRSPAPNYLNGENPEGYLLPGYNQDGYSFETDYWTAVGFLPTDPSDFYVLLGYDYHSTGSEDGFLGQLNYGYFGTGLGGFLVINGNQLNNNQVRDFGLNNNYGYPGTPSQGDYMIEGTESIQDCYPDIEYGPFTIGTTHIIHSYDINLTPGTYPVLLDVQSDADLGIAIFDPSLSYGSVFEALLHLNDGGAGVDEAGVLTATDSGYYGIVIYKTGHTDLPLNAVYSFTVGEIADRIPSPVTDLTLIPVELDGTDDYYHFDFQFSDVTTDIYGDPLVVDYYSIYWSWEPYDAFPAGWTYYTSSSVSEFLNVPCAAIEKLFVLVTAVDEDGVMSVVQGDRPVSFDVDELSGLPQAPLGVTPALIPTEKGEPDQ